VDAVGNVYMARTASAAPYNGVYRVELENGAMVLAHVADRLGTHFTRLLAGDSVGVELATDDRSRGRIREIRK